MPNNSIIRPFVRELTHEETIWIRDGDSKEDSNGDSNGTSNDGNNGGSKGVSKGGNESVSKKSDKTRQIDLSIVNSNILIRQ